MAERLRGRAGQVQRRLRLKAEPLCRRCKERGRIVAATVPDHIKPLAQGGTDDDSNIRCLCKPCHDEVTAEQFGHRPPTIGVDANGWPTDPAGSITQSDSDEKGATEAAQRIGHARVNEVAAFEIGLPAPLGGTSGGVLGRGDIRNWGGRGLDTAWSQNAHIHNSDFGCRR